MSDRLQAASAILNLIGGMTFASAINGQTTWVTKAARLRLWSQVTADEQPAAFLAIRNEVDEYRALALVRRRLEFRIFCYCRTDDPSVNGSDYLDTMMDAFEVAFHPDDTTTGRLTLGGLVYWCRIEGQIFKDPGDLDNQAMLVVPIVVEMP